MQILRMFSLCNEVILHNFLAFLPIQNGKILVDINLKDIKDSMSASNGKESDEYDIK